MTSGHEKRCSQYICLYQSIKHLNKGSLVPSMCTHGGSSFPIDHLRYLYKVIGCFVPRSGCSFLVPDARSSFRMLLPRSGCSFLILDAPSSFRMLVPRSGCSFLIPDAPSSFRMFLPRSGCSFRVPDAPSAFRMLLPRSGYNPRFITIATDV